MTRRQSEHERARSHGGPGYSFLSHLECSRTGERYDADAVQGLSAHDAPLFARYDLDAVAEHVGPADLASRPPTLWRYHELLPVRAEDHVVSLGEGMTPLVGMPTYGAKIGVPGLLVKDEGVNPTGTVKARGAAVGVSRARELGVRGVAMPSNGNAGAAWSAYAARAGLASLVAVPAQAPPVTWAECVVAGAELYLVDGLLADAGRLIGDAVAARDGYQEVSSLREPYRLEGKKTVGYEIAEQLGWRVPDVICCPTGDGTGLLGIHKALQELRTLGWIPDQLPRLVAVQAEGCAPIVRAFRSGAKVSRPVSHPSSLAFGLAVPHSLGDFLVLDAVRATGGTAVAVGDPALLAEQQLAAAAEGVFVCPEGAACLAAVRALRESGWLVERDRVLVLNTGTGLKHPQIVPVDVPTVPADGHLPPVPVEAVTGGT